MKALFSMWLHAVRLRLLRLFARAGLSEGVHYINGPETLPPPLTHAEEAAIMQRIREGAEAVSYTHLDVYKRQAAMGPPATLYFYKGEIFP